MACRYEKKRLKDPTDIKKDKQGRFFASSPSPLQQL